MKRDVSAIEVSLHSMNVLLDAFVSSSIRIRHYSSRKRHNSLMFCIETTYEVSVEALSSIKPENVAAKKTGPFSEAPFFPTTSTFKSQKGNKIVEALKKVSTSFFFTIFVLTASAPMNTRLDE